MLRPLLKLKGYRMLLRPSSCHTVHELPWTRILMYVQTI
jgi:hypothetical protein